MRASSLIAWTVAASIAAAATPAAATGGDSDLTDGLNTAGATVGICLVAADVAFTVADIVLLNRGERLSTGWSIAELVASAPIAVLATGYSFQARPTELLLTIPIAVWTTALTIHGIYSLAKGGAGPRGEPASRGSSWALAPSVGESAGHQFGALTAFGRF
jgi:hypothetical protein